MNTSRARNLKIVQFVIYTTFVLLVCAHLCVAFHRQNLADEAESFRRPVTHGEVLDYMRQSAPSAYLRLRDRGHPDWQPTAQTSMSITEHAASMRR